jgi:hypothetical protein
VRVGLKRPVSAPVASRLPRANCSAVLIDECTIPNTGRRCAGSRFQGLNDATTGMNEPTSTGVQRVRGFQFELHDNSQNESAVGPKLPLAQLLEKAQGGASRKISAYPLPGRHSHVRLS